MEHAIRLPVGSEGAVPIAQITDLHLPEEVGALVGGVDADDALRRVLAAINGSHCRRPDLILATGDIADTGAASTYKRFGAYMQGLQVPAYGLPGNHDASSTLSDMWRGHLPRWIDTPAWRIVMLDSVLPGKDAGMLGEQGLAALRAALNDAPAHVLVVLHHHPVPVGSPWLDCVMLQDADAFFQCLAQYRQVRAVLCGHVHQHHDSVQRLRHTGGETAIRILAPPSTAFQFMPRTHEYCLDTAGPAYRWLVLHADGALDTGVEYLPPRP